MPLVEGCRIVVNPFFDITGINASLWFARASFDQPLMVIHGDVVMSDELAATLFSTDAESLVAYDSSVLDPKEINITVTDDRGTRFGVNFSGYSGAYAGVFKPSAHASRMFADTLGRRVQRGFNEPRTYYFFVMRKLIADTEVVFVPFDFARYRWKSITLRTSPSPGRKSTGEATPMQTSGQMYDVLDEYTGAVDCTILDDGLLQFDLCEFATVIRSILDGQVAELTRDRNSICYRVCLSGRKGTSSIAIVKMPRPGPQRTNDDETFAWEAKMLVMLPAPAS